ncbi:cell division protein FtsK [Escherichia coli]|uniref:cell division protein FtsK n=1 Tax=Escherichia coli TaxID=562 RepID=UPI001C438715|nr:cell division protein FtsK [Escherichia coli]MBW0059773.1 cell division protein FtsK [Escherichia coli]
MLRELFHFLGAWLLSTLFIFLGCAVVIAVLIVGAMFITWSFPDVPSWVELLFGIRVILAFSAFMGFCWAASPDWDEPW